jgi:hypothetical protein
MGINTGYQDIYRSGLQPEMTTDSAQGAARGGPRQDAMQGPGMAQNVPQDMEDVLVLIQLALRQKSNLRHYFAYLLTACLTPEDVTLIMMIRNEMMRNLDLFVQLYFELAGEPPPEVVSAPYEQPATYCEGLRNTHLRLQEQLALLRDIQFQMSRRRHINTMTQIITDLARHIGILNYLHTKTGCRI